MSKEREALEAARGVLWRMNLEGGKGFSNHEDMQAALAKIDAALRELDEAKPACVYYPGDQLGWCRTHNMRHGESQAEVLAVLKAARNWMWDHADHDLRARIDKLLEGR